MRTPNGAREADGRPLFVRLAAARGFRQTRRQDPHQLRGRLCAHLGPNIRQVVLDGRVRQAPTLGGRLLRPGHQDRRDDVALL
jgi:hypothetical protein